MRSILDAEANQVCATGDHTVKLLRNRPLKMNAIRGYLVA